MSNNEKMVSGHWVACSPAWIEAGGNCATAPRILCGQGQGISHMHPAHHGEPVALPARKGVHLRYASQTPQYDKGWNACLDEIAKLGPLYTRPVQGEPVGVIAGPSAPKFGVLAGEPEIIGERCKDGGVCHHGCTQTCFRRLNCGALTGSGLNPDWSEPSAPVERKP